MREERDTADVPDRPNVFCSAQALVYVLEGTIVMQVRGGTPVTLAPGQTFYEGPDDVHIVGRNESQTAPAKFLVKDKGAPVLTPIK